MNYSDRLAQASYDAMLARGDGKGDEPTYDANVVIEGLRVPEGKNRVDAAVDLSPLMELDTDPKFYEEGGVLFLSVEGHLEDITAGSEEDEKLDLIGKLEDLGYEDHTAIMVQSYEEYMDR